MCGLLACLCSALGFFVGCAGKASHGLVVPCAKIPGISGIAWYHFDYSRCQAKAWNEKVHFG